jgi:serine/threonine protein kinase
MQQDAEQMPSGSLARVPDKDPLVGTVLLKRYEVLEQIGTGRFSVVYKARQLLMNRLVAIKSLKRDLLDEKEVVQRFKKEARALSRLRHPNIVAVFDCFESQNGRPYLVMDYLDGMSLEDLLSKNEQLDEDMVKPIFLQVCDALAHAHKQGVLHRDLKPGNMVLLAETKGTELVQLVDFGLAQVEEEVQKLTQDGECCGSPAYMSPEHCTGEPLDGRSDIYSFGVVMYETLTGVVPFKGRTSVETMRLQVYENPPSFHDVRPDLSFPADVEATIMRCLEKDPQKRYQTAGQVKDSIQNWGKVARAPRTMPKSLTVGLDQRPAAPAAFPENDKTAPARSAAAPPASTPPPPQPAAAANGKAKAPQPPKSAAEGATANKLKRWTDTQQKANELRTPILMACFLGAVVLAITGTLIFAHKNSNANSSGSSISSPVDSSGLGETSSTTMQPVDDAAPPSTLTSPNGTTETLPAPLAHPDTISNPLHAAPTTAVVAPPVTAHPAPVVKPAPVIQPEPAQSPLDEIPAPKPVPVVTPAPVVKPAVPLAPAVKPALHAPSAAAPVHHAAAKKPRKKPAPRPGVAKTAPVAAPPVESPAKPAHRRAYQTY